MLDPLATSLAKTLADLLKDRGGELLPATSPGDEEALDTLRAQIEELRVTLPRLALHVPERHLRGGRVPDPAAETALLQVVRALGFMVAPVPGERERTWIEKTTRGEGDFPAPRSLAADLAVVGEAFSEYAGRVGRFVSCRARVEIRVYDVKTGRIVATHVGKGSKADLSESFAGKLALEALGKEAARAVALDLAREGREKTPPTPTDEK